MKHTGMGAVALLSCALFVCSCVSTSNHSPKSQPKTAEELVSRAESGDSMALVNLGLLYEHKSIPNSDISFDPSHTCVKTKQPPFWAVSLQLRSNGA